MKIIDLIMEYSYYKLAGYVADFLISQQRRLRNTTVFIFTTPL